MTGREVGSIRGARATARALAAGGCLCACGVAPHLLLEERIQMQMVNCPVGWVSSIVLYLGSSLSSFRTGASGGFV